MRTSRRKLDAMREEVRQGPDRSPLYWWMVRHFTDLVEEGRSGRMPWKRLCVRLLAEGILDGSGKAPTPARAAKTWIDACREVEARSKRIRSADERQVPARSRPDPDWQPRVVAPRAPQPSAGQPDNGRRPSQDDWLPRPINSQGAMALPSKDRQPVSEEEAEARLAKLRRTFAERSGH